MDFETVAVTRSYEQVVRQIHGAIRAGGLTRGQRLPTERELGVSFGVSRAVVREAIKVLSAMGLVEPRQGSGLYVRDDPVPTVSRALTLSVSPEAKSLDRLFEFRRSLEASVAWHAAERRTEAQAGTIQAEAEASQRAAAAGDPADFGAADDRFHAAIYAAADNPYLAVTVGAVRAMQRDVIALFTEMLGSISIAADHHLRIAAAIAAGAATAAAGAMDEHIAYTAEKFAEPLAAAGAGSAQKGGRPTAALAG